MERDTNQRRNGDLGPSRYHEDDRYRLALDYDDRDDADGHWEDGHRSGAVLCAVVAVIGLAAGIAPLADCFAAAAVICACLPRWRRH